MVYISPQLKGMKRIEGIVVTVTGYVYSPGSIALKKSLTADSYKDFQIYMAIKLCETFQDAIEKQRYRTGSRAWKPLSITYYQWKKKNKLSLNTWEATGTLKKGLRVFKKGNKIAVGFRPNDYYPKTNVQINKVARYVEFGGARMPARPLFRPLTEYVRKNVDRYYKSYQKELDKSKKEFLYL